MVLMGRRSRSTPKIIVDLRLSRNEREEAKHKGHEVHKGEKRLGFVLFFL
jgi:hypothetical protein